MSEDLVKVVDVKSLDDEKRERIKTAGIAIKAILDSHKLSMIPQYIVEGDNKPVSRILIVARDDQPPEPPKAA